MAGRTSAAAADLYRWMWGDGVTRDELIALLTANTQRFAATGSRVICDPPPMDTDEDYVCLAHPSTEGALVTAGFEASIDPEMYEDLPDFIPYRCGEFNVIVTESEDFYERFVQATEEAKRLNLTEKSDRIALFQRVLYRAEAVN
jgi:hypothetical protein